MTTPVVVSLMPSYLPPSNSHIAHEHPHTLCQVELFVNDLKAGVMVRGVAKFEAWGDDTLYVTVKTLMAGAELVLEDLSSFARWAGAGAAECEPRFITALVMVQPAQNAPALTLEAWLLRQRGPMRLVVKRLGAGGCFATVK